MWLVLVGTQQRKQRTGDRRKRKEKVRKTTRTGSEAIEVEMSIDITWRQRLLIKCRDDAQRDLCVCVLE